MSRFEQRRNVVPQVPPFAVTKVDENGFGVDVAWFFKHSDARDYEDWRNARATRELREKGRQIKDRIAAVIEADRKEFEATQRRKDAKRGGRR